MTAPLGRRVVVCLLTLLVLTGTSYAQVPSFDAFYAFGDSLADNGNDFIYGQITRSNPVVPPSISPNRTYFNGRFSNGYVYVEYLWQLLSGNAPGSARGLKPSLSQPIFPLDAAIDFAFGGTGTPFLDQTPGGAFVPGLKGQIELFRAGLARRRPRRALYVIFTGFNDYRNDPFNVPMSIDDVVANIVDSVERLYDLGARDVMVMNLPDLGLVPANAQNPGPATALSVAHNAALKTALDKVQVQLPRLHLIQPDLVTFFLTLPAAMDRMVPALEALFFGDPSLPPGFHMSACLFIDPATCRDVPVPFNIDLNFLFWDIVHPTTEAHRALAGYVFSVLKDSYGHPSPTR